MEDSRNFENELYKPKTFLDQLLTRIHDCIASDSAFLKFQDRFAQRIIAIENLKDSEQVFLDLVNQSYFDQFLVNKIIYTLAQILDWLIRLMEIDRALRELVITGGLMKITKMTHSEKEQLHDRLEMNLFDLEKKIISYGNDIERYESLYRDMLSDDSSK